MSATSLGNVQMGFLRAAGMANILDLLMLIAACVGAMAFGILAAYGVLRVAFALMRTPRQPVALKTQPRIAQAS